MLTRATAMVVDRLGCGCPALDGRWHWHFYTNCLTVVVLGLAGAVAAIAQALLARRVPERSRAAYVAGFLGAIGLLCLFTMGRNAWL